jgi:hypothetical protein
MRLFTTGIALTLCLALAASAAAQEEEKRENETSSFEIVPYFWMAGMKGTVGVRGLGSEVGVRFTDLVENLDFGAMAVAKLRLKRWTITADACYMKLSADAETPGLPFSGSHIDSEFLMGSLTLGYTMTMEDRGLAEFFAGARAWRIDTDVDFDAGTLPATSMSQQWRTPARAYFGILRMRSCLCVEGESTSQTQSGGSVNPVTSGNSGMRSTRQPARSGTRTSSPR